MGNMKICPFLKSTCLKKLCQLWKDDDEGGRCEFNLISGNLDIINVNIINIDEKLEKILDK